MKQNDHVLNAIERRIFYRPRSLAEHKSSYFLAPCPTAERAGSVALPASALLHIPHIRGALSCGAPGGVILTLSPAGYLST